MPRASRKERKTSRQRQERAASRGLPTAEIEPRRARAAAARDGLEAVVHDASPAPAATALRPGWFSTWPWSVKLLGLATLVLLAFALWRTTHPAVEGGSAPAPDTARPK